MARTLKAALEKHYDLVHSSNHVIVPWMLRHSAWLITRYQKRDSGVTAFQEARGSPYKGI
eukprot:10102744-Alexandrium_andersonii.AAC.1